MQIVVSKTGNTNLTLSVYTFPHEVPVKKFGNLRS